MDSRTNFFYFNSFNKFFFSRMNNITILVIDKNYSIAFFVKVLNGKLDIILEFQK